LIWSLRRNLKVAILGGAVMRKVIGYLSLGLLLLVALQLAPAQAAPGQRTVAVTLNYDFTVDAACSATVTKNRLQQFNISDVTTGTPVKLAGAAAARAAR
jgi:hypothetical protein